MTFGVGQTQKTFGSPLKGVGKDFVIIFKWNDYIKDQRREYEY